MIITYTSNPPDRIIKSLLWEARRYSKSNDTQIISLLWQTISNNREMSFLEIGEKLQKVYAEKFVRSKASIYVNDQEIEVLTKGVFPHILILRNEN